MPTKAQIDEVLANPDAYSEELVKKARQLVGLDPKPAQRIATTPKPTTDPFSGAPVGDAPPFLVNALPSLINLGDDLISGFGAAASRPIGTALNLIPGTYQHYNQRYFGEDAPGFAKTFSADPAGALADISLFGGGLSALGKLGKAPAVSAVGRNIERLDPVGMAMGAIQTGVAGLQNRLPFIRTPEEVMAGSYGMPRGAQRENLPEYLETVGRAMDQELEPTVAGSVAAKQASSEAGTPVGEILDEMEAAGEGAKRSDFIRKLIELQRKRPSETAAPYRNAIDSMITDLMKSETDFIGVNEIQRLKEEYAGMVNYDSATPAVERRAQQGYDAAAKVLRENLRARPPLRAAYDEFSDAKAVEDIVGRGAAADIAQAKGITGDILAQGLNLIAPVLTGQGKLKRNKLRRDLSQGNYLGVLDLATEPTFNTRMREGLYAADMAGKTDEKWTVGMLWEGN
jgi:hypothetical protein